MDGPPPGMLVCWVISLSGERYVSRWINFRSKRWFRGMCLSYGWSLESFCDVDGVDMKSSTLEIRSLCVRLRYWFQKPITRNVSVWIRIDDDGRSCVPRLRMSCSEPGISGLGLAAWKKIIQSDIYWRRPRRKKYVNFSSLAQEPNKLSSRVVRASAPPLFKDLAQAM